MSLSNRVVFMGSSEFSLPALEVLIRHHQAGSLNLVSVYTQPPKVRGRGQYQRLPTAVHQKAMEHCIEAHTPKNFKKDQDYQTLNQLKPHLLIVASYGLILPQRALDIPLCGAVNLHPSPLPRWRGAAPIQHTLLNQDPETAVTLMKMDAGMDTGDIIAKRNYSLASLPKDAKGLTQALAAYNSELLEEWLPRLLQGGYPHHPQAKQGATIAHKLSRKDGALDWRKSSGALLAQIHALSPWPGSFFFFPVSEPKKAAAWLSLKVTKASSMPLASQDSEPLGTVAWDPFRIRCADGWFLPEEVTPPGKQTMLMENFLRGSRLGSPPLVLPNPAQEGS